MAITVSKQSNEESTNKFGHIKNQFLAVVCVNLISLSHGCMVGWLSPSLLVLLSDQSPMNGGPLTVEQVSWIAAISNLGGLIGNFVYSTINSYLGRKKSLCLLAFPSLIFWIGVFFTNDVEYIYALRIIAGLTGGGMIICIPLYIAEIASDYIRGTLGSMMNISMNIGILIAYLVGAYLPYNIVPCVHGVFPILFFCGTIFLPETPRYLMAKGRTEEAEMSVRFYKGCKQNTNNSNERFQIEMNQIISYATTQSDHDQSKVTFKDFCTPEARQGMMIALGLICLNVFSGGLLLLNYASSIFQQSGSNMDPNTSSIIMIALQLFGASVAIFLVDRVGRRILLIVSSIGSGTGLALMGAFSFLAQHDVDISSFNWGPVMSLSLAVFMSSIGFIPLTFVVVGEVLPSKIRDLGSTICLAQISLFLLVAVKLFPTLSEAIGMHVCFWFFTAVCVGGLIFVIFVLPETNGKNINEQNL